MHIIPVPDVVNCLRASWKKLAVKSGSAGENHFNDKMAKKWIGKV